MALRAFITGLLFTAALCSAAADRLYLKDGTYQLVREYEVKQDRVRYYSPEQGEWEEIPLELVDLERTKKEIAAHASERAAEAKADAEERAAVKAMSKQVASVPPEPGAYYIASDDKTEPLAKAEPKIVTDKKRTVLKLLSPIPLVPGKATVELDGVQAPKKIASDRPEFFFRLSADERFEIIKLTVKRAARVVETLSILAVKGDQLVDENVKAVPSFKKQEDDGLYRMWPEKPLEPGEYALIQFTEGKMNPQIWDFSVSPK